MRITLKIISILLLSILLTLITQIGGIVYLISIGVSKVWKRNFSYKSLSIFISLYLISTLLIVPLIAPVFGREKVKHTAKIRPTNYVTVLLNRNYVRPELNKLLSETANIIEKSNIKIHYLDANFPFINKFPLLPHLSHNDGKKIDISLIYETKEGQITDKQKSMSGYGIFEDPTSKEYSQINQCLKKGYYQYDYPKYVTFGSLNKELIFSEKGTKILIQSFLNNSSLGKLFIEPHLKKRMNLVHSKIRYHGCKAVRHDDHIHIQLK